MNDTTSNLDPQAEPATLSRGPQSIINRSAVKAYALKVSKERRAGKFTRVGESFLEQIEAQAESVIRQVVVGEPVDIVQPEDDRLFVTGAALDKFQAKFNERVRAIIQSKVVRHPTVGCTLMD